MRNGLAVFLFFVLIFLCGCAPKEVTTKMLESEIVEEITNKEIINKLEEVNLVSFLSEYYENIEQIVVDVSMPNFVKQNPTRYQHGDRYDVRDGYAYRMEELPLEVYLTIRTASGEEITTDPLDITVSGSIVYVTDAKSYAFRGVKIEYGEDFKSLLSLSGVFSWYD